MGTFVPVSTYCRDLSLYINVSDIRIIKIIVNVNTALAPILPYFERETFHEPKCKWVLDHFSKTLWKPGKDKVREKESQQCMSQGIMDVYIYLYAGLISLVWAVFARQSFNVEQKYSWDFLFPTSSHICTRVKCLMCKPSPLKDTSTLTLCFLLPNSVSLQHRLPDTLPCEAELSE